VWLAVTRGRGLDRPAVEGPAQGALGTSALRLLATPPVLRAVLAVAGSAPALLFVLNWTSKYLVDGWHLPKETIGNYLVAAPLLFDLGAVGFGYWASRREDASSPRRTHRDLVLVAMTLAASLALAPLAPSPAFAIALCAASACGGGGLYVLATSDMLARVPIERTSTAGGMTAGAQSLAHILASPLIGSSVDATHSYDATLLVLGLLVVPTSLAFVAWPMPPDRTKLAGCASSTP